MSFNAVSPICPWGSELTGIVYTPVCQSQEHHVSLFLSKGDLQCQLVRLLVSGCAAWPFVSALLPAGTQKAAPDFEKGRQPPQRRGKEEEKRMSDFALRVDSATRWVRERGDGDMLRQARRIVGTNVWSEEDR